MNCKNILLIISTFVVLLSSCQKKEGCMDLTASNYDPEAKVEKAGDCVYPISGCTNFLGKNYDSDATVDDGSCLVYNTFEIYAIELSWETDINNWDGKGEGGDPFIKVYLDDELLATSEIKYNQLGEVYWKFDPRIRVDSIHDLEVGSRVKIELWDDEAQNPPRLMGQSSEDISFIWNHYNNSRYPLTQTIGSAYLFKLNLVWK